MKNYCRMLAALFLVSAVLGTVKPADAGKYSFHLIAGVHNSTDRCAWVTVYYAYPGIPWRINKFDHAQPQWLKAGSIYPFTVQYEAPGFIPAEIKVRWELMRSSACQGNRGTPDISRELKNIYGVKENPIHGLIVGCVVASVAGSNGNYTTSIKQKKPPCTGI